MAHWVVLELDLLIGIPSDRPFQWLHSYVRLITANLRFSISWWIHSYLASDTVWLNVDCDCVGYNNWLLPYTRLLAFYLQGSSVLDPRTCMRTSSWGRVRLCNVSVWNTVFPLVSADQSDYDDCLEGLQISWVRRRWVMQTHWQAYQRSFAVQADCITDTMLMNQLSQWLQ